MRRLDFPVKFDLSDHFALATCTSSDHSGVYAANAATATRSRLYATGATAETGTRTHATAPAIHAARTAGSTGHAETYHHDDTHFA
jgi:hypothetical protein